MFLALAFASASVSAQSTDRRSKPDSNKTDEFGHSLKQYGRSKRQKSPKPQPKASEPDDDSIRIETNLVAIDFMVANKSGSLIRGLTRDDIVITEDGVPQKIEMFSFANSESRPRSIVLILCNHLMQGPILETSKAATRNLIQLLGDKDEMAVVTSDMRVRQSFTSDKKRLYEAIDAVSVNIDDFNSEWDALLAVLNELFGESDRQRIVVFQGDGSRSIWLKPDGTEPIKISRSTRDRTGYPYGREKMIRPFGFRDVEDAISSSGATIYSVITFDRMLGKPSKEQLEIAIRNRTRIGQHYGWGDASDRPAIAEYYKYADVEIYLSGQSAMFAIAQFSGGYADFIENPADANRIYSDISKVLDNRYSVGYYPLNQERKGKTRQIRIEIRDHPELIVSARKSYVF
ncbi:MAG: hypothetical protein KIT41_10955 [Pyrinomonadaceae bacterium]|nr:hypothetical protein [Pyrinomonadaceae bacterium]